MRDHECPRKGCTKRVSNTEFACRTDWYALSTEVRKEIWATVGLNLLNPRRRAAFEAARKDWDALAAEVSDPIPSTAKEGPNDDERVGG